MSGLLPEWVIQETLRQTNSSTFYDLVIEVTQHQFHAVQLFSHVQLFITPWTQHARLSCPSPTPRACSNSCPLSQWCHPTISSSVVPFSFCLQSFPASGTFPVSQLFASGGQSIGVSASEPVPMNIQDWFSSGLTGMISLPSKGLSRVFFKPPTKKHFLWAGKSPLLSGLVLN